MSEHESVAKPASYYVNEPPINNYIETFFANYASISITTLRDHLLTVRDRAWQKCNYPCLGRWVFLQFSIQNNPIYKEIIEKCKSEGATVIDFACCLGQDVRQLVYNGVPINRIRGYDLDPFFIEQGYELFRDGEIMKQNKVFNSGDIFDDQFLDAIEPADYINVGAFFHIFDAETQRDVCRRLTRLCKRAIIGWKTGALIPTEVPKPLSFKGTMMWHSPESFIRMWDEVTDGKWQVESTTLQTMDGLEDLGLVLAFVVRKRGEQ
ncbi:unnamed protein product [Rotaria sordida]|uniref:Methyltransferase domain-containing protein n=1 Tax=Rotaria sordida TaxID=392033 RepID=A0A815K8M4_9BILA|nr:unnamed protein product [Rotaria sordida]CAF1453523.1 unnamed protein product [Rotaria sordida]CAF3804620.1 unnamed protein product [Rotaria sordida]CAF3960013.1 unnamed protein product [Rotaria sordida]